MRHIGCRVPDCISRGEVAVPTWRASARGRWVPLPRPHPPHGSSPTAHRPPPVQKASCRGRSGILETPAENWVGLGFGGCQRLAGKTVTRPRRLLFCRQAACEWRTVKGRGPQAPLPWPVRARIPPRREGASLRGCLVNHRNPAKHTAAWRRRHPSPLRAQARRLRQNHWHCDHLCSSLAPRPGAWEGGGGGAPSREQGAAWRQQGPAPETGKGPGQSSWAGGGPCSWSCRAGCSGEGSSQLLRWSVLTLCSCQSPLARAARPGAAGSPTAGPLRRPRLDVGTRTCYTHVDTGTALAHTCKHTCSCAHAHCTGACEP